MAGRLAFFLFTTAFLLCAPAGAQSLASIPSYSDIDWCAWENIPEEEAQKAYDRFETSMAAMSEIIRNMQDVHRDILRRGGPEDFVELTVAVTATRHILVLEAAWYRQKRILDCLAEKLEAYIVARDKLFGGGRGGRGGTLSDAVRAQQDRLAEIRAWLDGFRGLVDGDGNPAVIIQGTQLILPVPPGGQGGMAYPGGGAEAGTRYVPIWNPIDRRWEAVPAGPQNPIGEDRYADLGLILRDWTGGGTREPVPGGTVRDPSRLLERESRIADGSVDTLADGGGLPPLSPPLEFVLKGGIGANLSAKDLDLDPFNQFIVRDPAFAGRFGAGLVWRDVIGGGDVGLDLVAIYGRTINDRLGNPSGGALNTSGRTDYVGLLPFVSVEFPIIFDWSVFVGGGLGLGHQWSELTVGGVSQAKASGTGLLGQIGGGIRVPVTPCTDVGLEGYYTLVGDIDGRTAGGTTYTQDGAEDVSFMLSLRTRFSDPFGPIGEPILDTQAFATCP